QVVGVGVVALRAGGVALVRRRPAREHTRLKEIARPAADAIALTRNAAGVGDRRRRPQTVEWREGKLQFVTQAEIERHIPAQPERVLREETQLAHARAFIAARVDGVL